MDNKEKTPTEQFDNLSAEDKKQCDTMVRAAFVNEEADGSKTIIQELCEIAKRFPGYTHISLSRFKGFPEGGRPLSATGELLRLSYTLTQGKNNKDFIDAFTTGEVGIIQAHKEAPPLHEDGLYDQRNVARKLIPTKMVGFCKIIDVENFKPCMVVKQGGGKLGYIEGSPFYEMTPDAFKRAVDILQKPAE